MKFIHAADLHLDTPFEGIKNDINTPNSLWELLRKAPYNSFKKLVNDAIEKKVDFVLLVGDIFDVKKQSPQAVNFFIEQLNLLNNANIPVMLSFGNHDYQSDDGKHFAFPDNVYVFPSKVTTHRLVLDDGKSVDITGFSYNKQAITDDKVTEFPMRSDADYQIGMVHGNVKTGDNSNYAPFTVNEMVDKDYDYWALGHIHKRSELNTKPMIEYPGDIQGRHKNEPGEKGYLLISDDKGSLTKEFIATSDVIYSNLEVSIDATMNITAVVDKVITVINNKNFTKFHLLNLNLNIADEIPNEEVSIGIENNTFLESIEEGLKDNYREVKAWIYDINLIENKELHFTDLGKDYWDETEKEIFNHENIAKMAKKLFKNSFIRDRFNSDEELQEITKKSRNLLRNKTKGDDDNNDN